jgi:hypothetical protein
MRPLACHRLTGNRTLRTLQHLPNQSSPPGLRGYPTRHRDRVASAVDGRHGLRRARRRRLPTPGLWLAPAEGRQGDEKAESLSVAERTEQLD